MSVICLLTISCALGCGTAQDDVRELLKREQELGTKLREIARDTTISAEKKKARMLELRDEMIELRKQLSPYRLDNLRKLESGPLERQAEYVRLNSKLEFEENMFSQHPKDDFLMYRVFQYDSVMAALDVDESTTKKLRKSAGELDTVLRKSVGLAIANGKPEKIGDYRRERTQFEESLKKELKPGQLRDLEEIETRCRLWAKGLDALIKRLTSEKLLKADEVANLKVELQKTATEIVADGNKLFLEKIEELLPGYIESKKITTENLIFPLRCFLLAVEQADHLTSLLKKCKKEYKFSLSSGMWALPYPMYRRDPFGGLLLVMDKRPWVPNRGDIRSLAKSIDSDLSADQRKFLSDLITRGPVKRDTTVDRNTARFEAAKKWNAELEGAFLDFQLEKYKNQIRFLLLFTVGPKGIWESLPAESRPSRSAFEDKLVEVKDELENYIKESEERLIKVIKSRMSKSSNFDFGKSHLLVYETILSQFVRTR